MAGWRDLKRKALADIHRTFEIPAVYLTHLAGIPAPVNVRLHLKQIVSEQQIGDWSSAGSMLDMTSRVIFRAADVPTVMSRSYVIFGPEEVYVTGPSKPEREQYIWCEVEPLKDNELARLLTDMAKTPLNFIPALTAINGGTLPAEWLAILYPPAPPEDGETP